MDIIGIIYFLRLKTLSTELYYSNILLRFFGLYIILPKESNLLKKCQLTHCHILANNQSNCITISTFW